MKAERAASTTDNGWPKIRREDMHISPEVMKLVEDIEPLPDDFDYDKARLEYLLKKHGSMKKVFLDTHILIDYLARRSQFFEPAAQIVQLGQQH